MATPKRSKKCIEHSRTEQKFIITIMQHNLYQPYYTYLQLCQFAMRNTSRISLCRYHCSDWISDGSMNRFLESWKICHGFDWLVIILKRKNLHNVKMLPLAVAQEFLVHTQFHVQSKKGEWTAIMIRATPCREVFCFKVLTGNQAVVQEIVSRNNIVQTSCIISWIQSSDPGFALRCEHRSKKLHGVVQATLLCKRHV